MNKSDILSSLREKGNIMNLKRLWREGNKNRKTRSIHKSQSKHGQVNREVQHFSLPNPNQLNPLRTIRTLKMRKGGKKCGKSTKTYRRRK